MIKPSLLICVLAATVVGNGQTPRRKNAATIAKEANGAVVSIVMSDKEGHPIAQGSGFLISKDGRVVTNYHVIKSGSSGVIKLPYGASFPVEGVLVSDKHRDVAIIKAHGNDFRTLILGDSDRLQVGEEVVAIGSPLSLESTVSNGIVSGIRTVEEEGGKFLQITAPISPGSSGGPLFNTAGEVVGITTSHLRGGENLNFAIPIDDVKYLSLLPRLAKARAFPDEAEDDTTASSPRPDRKTFGNAIVKNSLGSLYFAKLCFFDSDSKWMQSCDVIGYLATGTRVQAVYTEVSGYPTDTDAFSINRQRISSGTGNVCEITTEEGREGWLLCTGVVLDDDALEMKREKRHACYMNKVMAYYGSHDVLPYGQWYRECELSPGTDDERRAEEEAQQKKQAETAQQQLKRRHYDECLEQSPWGANGSANIQPLQQGCPDKYTGEVTSHDKRGNPQRFVLVWDPPHTQWIRFLWTEGEPNPKKAWRVKGAAVFHGRESLEIIPSFP